MIFGKPGIIVPSPRKTLRHPPPGQGPTYEPSAPVITSSWPSWSRSARAGEDQTVSPTNLGQPESKVPSWCQAYIC